MKELEQGLPAAWPRDIIVRRARLGRSMLMGLTMLLAAASAAHASLIFTLDNDGCTGGCGTVPFGTVSVSQDSSSAQTIDFKVTLNALDDLEFNKTTVVKTHPMFAVDINVMNVTFGNFKINNVATTKVTTSTSAASNVAPFGSFPYSLSAATNLTGVLTFTATVASGTLAPSDIISNGHAYMTADIINLMSGHTGNVGAEEPPVRMPEPGGAAILGVALAALSVARSRRVPISADGGR